MTAVETTALSRQQERGVAISGGDWWTIERIVEQKRMIQECMAKVMREGEHFGIIPGTPKPSLWKAGAETLGFLFRLSPDYVVLESVVRADLISYVVKCILTHIPSGAVVATGMGACNSREAKYIRPAPKRCPKCSKETIIKGKEEYGGGWLCFAKKGGCGEKYKQGDDAIEKQEAGVADPADLHNTIVKMACKRSNVAATLSGTAASDFFTQDLEDLAGKVAEYEPPPRAEPSTPGPRRGNASREERAAFRGAMGEPTIIDEPATHAQVTLIHALKTKANYTEDRHSAKLWGSYKVKSSAELTTEQATEYIEYLEAELEKRTAEAASRVAEVGEALEEMGAGPAEADTGEPATDEAKTLIRGEVKRLGWKTQFARLWLTSRTGQQSLDALSQQQASDCYLLLRVHGTDKYDAVLEEMAQEGRVGR